MNARTILLAEDDPDDRLLLETAFTEKNLNTQVQFVTDGEELMDYLLQHGPYASNKKYPRPDIVMLDLNMPRKDGREALQEIRENPEFQNLDIVVLTTSNLEEDEEYCRKLGVTNYMVKPNTYSELLELIDFLQLNHQPTPS